MISYSAIHARYREPRPQLRPAPHSENACALTLATARVCMRACNPRGLWRLPTAHKHPEDFARYGVRAYDAISYACSPPDCNSFYQAREATRSLPLTTLLSGCAKNSLSHTQRRQIDRKYAACSTPHSHAPPKVTPAYHHTLLLTSNGLRLGNGFMANSSENTILERQRKTNAYVDTQTHTGGVYL